MVSEGCLKLIDERDLEVEHFMKIYDNFLSTSALLKVRKSSQTVCRMKMCIDGRTCTNASDAQMEVYPSLLTNLAADLAFMCNFFGHHLMAKLKLQDICILIVLRKESNLRKGINMSFSVGWNSNRYAESWSYILQKR